MHSDFLLVFFHGYNFISQSITEANLHSGSKRTSVLDHNLGVQALPLKAPNEIFVFLFFPFAD